MEAFNALGPNMQRTVIYMHMLNKLVPFQAIAMMAYAGSYMIVNKEKIFGTTLTLREIIFGEVKNKLDLKNEILMKKEIVDRGIIAWWTEVGFVQKTKDIAFKIKEIFYDNVIAWYRKLKIRDTIAYIGLKAWELVVMIATIMWYAIQLTLYIAMAAAIIALIAVLSPLIIAYGIYLIVTSAATIGTILFWIALTGGLIIVAVLVVGFIAALYQMAMELGGVAGMVSILKDGFMSWAEKITMIWEEHIYPFIYRVGMEFRALFGVLGIMISGWWQTLSENKHFETFMKGIKAVAKIIKMVLMAPILVLIATFKILWAAIVLVIDVFKALKNFSISGLKDAYKGFTGGVSGAISDLWESLKFWADGGYIKMQAAGGTSAPMNIVGERGPELFMPSQSGQIINTRRTQEILHDIKRRAGAATGMAGAQTMRVETLIANNSVSKKTRMSVDTFAGVI